MINKPEISKIKLLLGTFILVTGFLSPLLIPWVTTTSWSVGIKTTFSGLLAFGIPEIFMLVAVAVLGKPGYEYLKRKVLIFFNQLAPSGTVSLIRFRIGLVMFVLPLLVGWLQPYLVYFFPLLNKIPFWYLCVSDSVLLASFFVLGGDFWDKLRALFMYDVKVNLKG